MDKMTNEEAIAIIRKEYLCVDRDCDIERSCGKCDLVMPSKEPILQAYKLAIKALDQEPCKDAISREDALMALTGEYTDSLSEILPKAIKRINALPSVTPAEKVGQWEYNPLDMCFQCSQCKCCCEDDYKEPPKYNYCPHCGAKMQEVKE